MEVSLFRIADYALVSQDGKLSVMGLFDNIFTTQFPLAYPILFLVVELTAKSSEFNRQVPVEIHMLNEDGTVLTSINGTVNVGSPTFPSPKVNIPQVFQFSGVEFEKPGVYEFSIFVNNDLKATMPFEVRQVQLPA